MPNAFVDTNILVYAADQSSPVRKQTAIAREVLRQRDLWISVQVISEFTVNARNPNKLNLSKNQQRDWLDRLLLFSISAITVDTYLQSLVVHERYQLSHWDSLIVASALETGCAVIYSEDLNHGRDYNGTKVVNPFL